jgi:hypothetical protein
MLGMPSNDDYSNSMLEQDLENNDDQDQDAMPF